jgi:CxxC motif-containing protein
MGRLDEDTSQYSVNQVNQSKFEVLKDGEVAYTLVKKQSNWVCDCPGFKYRHQCKHLELIRPFLPKRHPRASITDAIKDFLPKLKKITPKVEVVGSYRRGKADSKDIDILMDCSAVDFKKVVTILESYPSYKPVMAGDTIIRGFINGIEMDINRLSENMNYYLALEYRTGPSEHNIAMRALAKKLNGSLSENELVVEGRNIKVTSEKDIYDALGVVYQDPTKRTDNLQFTKRANIGSYKVVNNGKGIGCAPSRMYAKQQIKDIRTLCKSVVPILTKDLETYSYAKADEVDKIDLRFTVSESEEVKIVKPFEIKAPDGNSVDMNDYLLKIKPVLKVNGVRVLMGDKITVNGKSKLLYEYMMEAFQREIDKKMKLPTHAVGKLCSNGLSVEGLPETMNFRTVFFPVEGVK